MRISRFYLPQALSAGATVELGGDSAHYAQSVLRLKKGAELAVFNGQGGEFSATVLEARKDVFRIHLGTFDPREAESALSTHLGLGISRGERMDLAIQKAVELGVSAITPLFAERCVVQLDQAKTEPRLRHWRRIAQSACEQCRRNRVPEIFAPAKLEDWAKERQGLRLFLDPHGGRRLRELPKPEGWVSLLSGPEGGFADHERRWALAQGFLPLRLGPRVLRTETAALAALAALQATWGDLG